MQTVGGTFMIPCVVFTAVSLLAEDFMKRLGHKTVRSQLWVCGCGCGCCLPPFVKKLGHKTVCALSSARPALWHEAFVPTNSHMLQIRS